MAFDPLDAARVGEFVVATYRMYNDGKAGLTPDPVGVPPGYTVQSYIIMDDFLPWKSMHEFYGIIAVNADGTQMVVAMRGTVGTTEWLDNVHAGLVRLSGFADCGSCEQGAGKIYSTMRVAPYGWDPHKPQATEPRTFAEQVGDAMVAHAATSAAKATAPPSVIVAGHSLGSALMTLYVMENAKKGIVATPLVYLFASPRVGDATFVQRYNELPGVTTWRIANKNDLVPNLPPDVWGFAHVDALALLDDSGVVKDSLACHHPMPTYMHLLDPAHWPLEPTCT